MRFLQFTACILFFTCPIYAQTGKNIDHQSILWTRYYNQLTLSNKWAIHTEFDNRVFLDPLTENLYVARLHGRYKISDNTETGLGFAYFSVATQDPNVSTNFHTPEYRSQQDITLKQKISNLILNHRYQLEERFFQKYDKNGLLPGTTFQWRFRYRIQADYTFWQNINRHFKTIISDELMINFGNKIIKNTFDQNRIYVAVQYGINQNFAFEIGYLNSFQQKSNGIDYLNRDIIRLSIFHKLSISKK